MHGTLSILPLRLDAVSFAVAGRPLIKDVSCAFVEGPRTVVLGPNGAGKTLLLRLCHGLLRPSGGRIAWRAANGTDVRRLQAMVFQRPVMLRRSVAANVDYALRLHDVPRAERGERIDEALALTGLRRFAGRAARTLSVGEQQKLALARAWSLRPQILFLDEPTASLDPSATMAVESIVNTIHGAGTKIVMTTHDLGQAKRLADHVLFLNRGRLVEDGPADAFFAAPKSREASAFLEGRLLGKHIREDH